MNEKKNKKINFYVKKRKMRKFQTKFNKVSIRMISLDNLI